MDIGMPVIVGHPLYTGVCVLIASAAVRDQSRDAEDFKRPLDGINVNPDE